MDKPKPKRNKRLINGHFHAGGPMIDKDSDVPSSFADSVIPSEISDEEVRRRRAVREDREDIQAAFGNGY